MSDLEVLYAFTSSELTVVEVMGSTDPSIWLLILGESRSVIKLDLEAMERNDEMERRIFTAAELVWNSAGAKLRLLGKRYELSNLSASMVSPVTIDHIRKSFIKPQRGDQSFELRSLRPSDLNFFEGWIRDPEVIRYSMTKFHRISNSAEIEAWFHGTLFDRKTYQIGIVDPKSKELIGYAGISSINEIDGNGEYFIFIGNKKFWGRGIASKVTKIFVHDAFKVLNLHRLFLTASSSNGGAIRAYEKAGFKHEGCLREAFFRNNQFSDKLVMGILRSEYICS